MQTQHFSVSAKVLLISLSLIYWFNFFVTEGLSAPPHTSDAATISAPVGTTEAPQTEPAHSAIALQPPNQSNTPQIPGTDDPSQPSCPPDAASLSHRHTEEEATPVITEVV